MGGRFSCLPKRIPKSNAELVDRSIHRSIPKHQYNNIPVYTDTVPFVAPVTEGHVVKVYDGDTITIASKLPYSDSLLYRFSVRLHGIDTPEMKTKDQDEKIIATKARDRVHGLVFGKLVELKDVQTEKYGRLLARVYITTDKGERLCINDILIQERLAVKYDGGTKICPISWIDFHEGNNTNISNGIII